MLQHSIRVLQPVSFKDWAQPAATFTELFHQDRRGQFLSAASPSTLRCKPPLLLDRPSERALFFPRGGPPKESYEIPLSPLRLEVIPRAQLVSDKFVVVSDDSRVFSESFWAEQNLNDGVYFQRQVSTVVAGSVRVRPTILFNERPPTRTINGPAILLGNPWAFNYHHWMINCLSKLWWQEQYPELCSAPLIVPAELKPFQEQSLSAMGVALERLQEFDGGPWQVERLLFPTNGDFWPDQLRWIRQQLFNHYGIAESTGQRRLYISRSDAPNRRIVNETEVVKLLESHGFERLELDGLPLGEQVKAFSQARYLIGPHGSGLTNVIFGATNLSTLELHPDDEINHVFWVMANAMQQPYAFLSGKRINTDRDFAIDLNDLQAMLSKLDSSL